MDNLYERLKAQREARASRITKTSRITGHHAPPHAKEPVSSDSRPATVRGNELRRAALNVSLPSHWRETDSHVWRTVFRTPVATEQLEACITHGGLLIGPEHRLEAVAFFDSETTGLSGGAGTTVFLVAIARLYRDAADTGRVTALNHDRCHREGAASGMVETTLLFLSDFSGEPSFLHAVRQELEQAETLVSYNGRAFDLNVLRNRLLLNRMQMAERPHIDLLYPARRLFSTMLDSCSLATVEKTLMNVQREQDIDGAEIPGRWLEFLGHGDASRLEEVFAHVHRDVLSLVQLMEYIETVAADPEAGVVDRFQRVRLLIESPYRRSSSLPLRREGLRGLEELARAVDQPPGVRAARYYCALQRRNGNREAAREVWRSFYQERRSVWAAEELAKDLEHVVGDLEAAHGVVVTAAGWSHAAPAAAAFEHRRRRLEQKLARRRSDAFRTC